MIIIFKDGGIAECSEIEVLGRDIIWDGGRYCDISDVDRIIEGEYDNVD